MEKKTWTKNAYSQKKNTYQLQREKQHHQQENYVHIANGKKRLQVKQKLYHPLFPFLMVGPLTYTTN